MGVQRRGLGRFGVAIGVVGVLFASVAVAADKEQLPIPRYVSMRHGEVNVRVGPGTRYPIAWVFTKQNMPVEITQEYENWRKIRDHDGTEGWVNAVELQGKRYVIVQGTIRVVRGDPSADGSIVARAEPGVLGKLEKCPGDTIEWCQVDLGTARGWLRRSDMWGVYPQEIYPAP